MKIGENMYYNKEKNISKSVLALFTALYIIFMPSVADSFGKVGLFSVASIMLCLFAWRIYVTEKIYYSSISPLFIALTVYVALTSFTAQNRDGHFYYFIISVVATIAIILLGDYFFNSPKEKLDKRLMYMISASGALCATVNTIYWFTYMLPIGENVGFAKGIGGNILLCVFMFFSILCTLIILRTVGGRRKVGLILMMLPILFVLIMTKSVRAIVFCIMIIAILIIRKKCRDKAFTISVILSAVIVPFLMGDIYSTPFKDAIMIGFKTPFGIGGGGFLAGQQFFASEFYKAQELCCAAQVVSASGIIGAAICVLLLLRETDIFLKSKSVVSAVSLLITVCLLFVPIAQSGVIVVLWMGILSYNEYSIGSVKITNVKKVKEKALALLFAAIFVVFVFCQSLISLRGDELCKKGDYKAALNFYRAASAISITDSESCAKAAVCIRKTDGSITEAVNYIDKAIARNKNEVRYLAEKARIYEAYGNFIDAEAVWKTVIVKAPYNSDFKLSTAKLIFKSLKQTEKGHAEAKKKYSDILEVANMTEDLEVKKKINDIADKALSYTKGELKNEG